MIIVIRSLLLLLSLIILFIIGFQKAFLYTYIHTCVSVIIFGYVRIQNTYIHILSTYIQRVYVRVYNKKLIVLHNCTYLHK